MSAPSSRLVRKEKSRLVKQTLIFGGVAIALVFTFIFIILPLFIAILNKVINTNPFPEAERIELQAPLLDAPVVATNSAQLQLTGFAQPKSKVTLLINSQASSTTSAGDDGAFTLPVGLAAGENTISVFSEDDAGNQSHNSQEFVVSFDKDSPKIVVDEPQPETHYGRKERIITVRGLTDPGSKIFINERLSFVGQDGTFSGTVSLQDGKNELKLVAVDAAGNRTDQTVIAYLDT